MWVGSPLDRSAIHDFWLYLNCSNNSPSLPSKGRVSGLVKRVLSISKTLKSWDSACSMARSSLTERAEGSAGILEMRSAVSRAILAAALINAR